MHIMYIQCTQEKTTTTAHTLQSTERTNKRTNSEHNITCVLYVVCAYATQSKHKRQRTMNERASECFTTNEYSEKKKEYLAKRTHKRTHNHQPESDRRKRAVRTKIGWSCIIAFLKFLYKKTEITHKKKEYFSCASAFVSYT